MGLFSTQFANVVEWNEFRDDLIFFKWSNDEIKKGSKLVIRPGQDAIFMYNGKIEGIFRDEGSFDIESAIIPFLSTLKGFKFGFNSGLRAEVVFINTKEFTEKWGTKNQINIPAEQMNLPGGLPIRAFGTFSFRVHEHQTLIDKIAGIKDVFSVEDIKERISSKLDQLLMKWIVREGKNLANLMAYSDMITKGIREDLDMEMIKIGISITDFSFQNISYPENVQKMVEKAASQGMVGDLGRYSTIAMADSLGQERGSGSNMASKMMEMQMGMQMANQMMNQMNASSGSNPSGGMSQQKMNTHNNSEQGVPNFCPECGTKTGGAKFCSNCGKKLG